MTLQEILEFVKENWGWGLAIVLSLVEVSKIKINPWSSLFKWLGNLFMAGVKKDIADLNGEIQLVKNDLNEMKGENREDKAKAARNRILICSDEVYQGVRHSKEYFDNILADITFYKRYCDEHPEFQNEMTVMATQRIESIYKKCLEEHGFL